MTKEQQLAGILLQANISLARAKHYELRIEAKSYLKKLGRVTDGSGRALSEYELLQSEIGTHHNHISRAQDCLDAYQNILSEE